MFGKRPRGLLGIAMFVAVLARAQAPVDGKKLATDVEQSVVKIVLVNSANQMNNVGTGFFVHNENLIATAAHVILEGERLIIDGGGGQLFVSKALRSGGRFGISFQVVGADYGHDVALLKIDANALKQQMPVFQIKPLELDDNKPKLGDEVMFEGYFGGDDFPLLSRTVIAGFTSAAPGAAPFPEQLVLDLSANPGQSGSPVLSLESGRVVGVLSSFVPVTLFPGTTPTHSGLSRSVEAEHLKKLIGSAEVR